MNVYVVPNNYLFDLSVNLDNSKLLFDVVYPAEPEHVPVTEGLILPEPLTQAPETDTTAPAIAPPQYSIDLESLRNRPDFGDHAYYVFYLDKTNDVPTPVLAKSIVNLYSLTVASKVDLGTYKSMVMQAFPLGVVYVPFADAPVSEWSIGLRLNADCNLTLGAGLVRKDGITLPTTGETVVFPEVKFLEHQATVTQDGLVNIPFKLVSAAGADITDHNADVYLDTTAGFLTSRRVRTINGQGTVQFRPDGLASGDVAKVKCGFKYFTGTDDCFVTVQ